MASVDEDIKKARELIESPMSGFIGFNTDTFIYRFTNESIELYKNYLMNRKKVLSVTASGDQVLNSILFGSKEIDSFDVSRFPKYYFELKKAAIETLTRDEFIDFFVGEHLSPISLFVILSSTVAFLLILTNWLCSSLITLPLASAIIDATLTSSPGLSGRRTDTVKILLLCTRPCCTTDDIVITSILPPERIDTIFLSFTSSCFKARLSKLTTSNHFSFNIFGSNSLRILSLASIISASLL